MKKLILIGMCISLLLMVGCSKECYISVQYCCPEAEDGIFKTQEELINAFPDEYDDEYFEYMYHTYTYGDYWKGKGCPLGESGWIELYTFSSMENWKKEHYEKCDYRFVECSK